MSVYRYFNSTHLDKAMDRKKISTTVYITQEKKNLLKLLNKKTKVPIAEYIREGIDLVLEVHKHQLPGQLSLLGDEPRAQPAKREPTLDN